MTQSPEVPGGTQSLESCSAHEHGTLLLVTRRAQLFAQAVMQGRLGMLSMESRR